MLPIANKANVKNWISENMGEAAVVSWQIICTIVDAKTAISALQNPEEEYAAIKRFIAYWDLYVLAEDGHNCQERQLVESFVGKLKELKFDREE